MITRTRRRTTKTTMMMTISQLWDLIETQGILEDLKEIILHHPDDNNNNEEDEDDEDMEEDNDKKDDSKNYIPLYYQI